MFLFVIFLVVYSSFLLLVGLIYNHEARDKMRLHNECMDSGIRWAINVGIGNHADGIGSMLNYGTSCLTGPAISLPRVRSELGCQNMMRSIIPYQVNVLNILFMYFNKHYWSLKLI